VYKPHPRQAGISSCIQTIPLFVVPYHRPDLNRLLNLNVPLRLAAPTIFNLLRRLREPEAVGKLVEDVDIVVCAAERLLAGTHGVDRHVGKRVHTLGVQSRQRAVDDEAADPVFGVDVVVSSVGRGDGSSARLGVELVVLAVVGIGAEAGSDGVPRGPVEREVGASVIANTGGGVGVLAETRVLVGSDGGALLAVGALFGEVLGVGIAKDAVRRLVGLTNIRAQQAILCPCGGSFATYSNPWP
jgi:hypothetical protein